MRNHSIILNKLWQYTGGCTIREKPYIIRERDLIMFSLFYFSDSAPRFILSAVAIILFFCFFRLFFFTHMCHSANSYNDFTHYSANGFTSPTHEWPICMPVICHSSPLAMKSYIKSLGRVPGVRSTSCHPHSPLQVRLFEVSSASGPTPLKCWVCCVWVHPSGLSLLATVQYRGHVTKS